MKGTKLSESESKKLADYIRKELLEAQVCYKSHPSQGYGYLYRGAERIMEFLAGEHNGMEFLIKNKLKISE